MTNQTPASRIGAFGATRGGGITRRQFANRAALSGIGALLASGAPAGARRDFDPSELDDIPDSDRADVLASLQERDGAARPAHGTKGQERGAGGELRILLGQPPTMLSPLHSGYYFDRMVGALTMEPLMHYLSDGTLVPNLVTEVPSVDNGLLARDLTSVTYTLLPGVTWSDGEPFTAADVRFTWEWNLNPDSRSWAIGAARRIEDVEVVDDLTLTVRFAKTEPVWFESHTGTDFGYIYPRHILGDGDGESLSAFMNAPIGTGPYKVDSFVQYKYVEYSTNDRYREPNKPFFSNVLVEHYETHDTSTREFFEKGTYDYCWQPAGTPEELLALAEESDVADLVLAPHGQVHALAINFSDPRTEADGQYSEMNTPHPFLSDRSVREAMALAIDRDAIANAAYLGADLEPPPASMLEPFPAITTPVSPTPYDPDRAMAVLEDASWVDTGDGVRGKDGMRLELTYVSIFGSPHEQTHPVVKANLEAVGFAVTVVEIDRRIFQDAMVANEQYQGRFRKTDIQVFQSTPDCPVPLDVLRQWYAGPDGKNIAQEANDWRGANLSRYINADYDALYEQALTETDRDRLVELCGQMSDILAADQVVIPLGRPRSRNGCIRTLNTANLELGPFTHPTWNIANWNRVRR